jgi:hypothetical protein
MDILVYMHQGFQMGIALPKFLLNMDGASGGIMLLGIVGLCILFPLMIAVIYLSRSSKYTGNYVMHQTLSTYYYFMKPSLAPRYEHTHISSLYLRIRIFFLSNLIDWLHDTLSRLSGSYWFVLSQLPCEHWTNVKMAHLEFWYASFFFCFSGTVGHNINMVTREPYYNINMVTR